MVGRRAADDRKARLDQIVGIVNERKVITKKALIYLLCFNYGITKARAAEYVEVVVGLGLVNADGENIKAA